MSVDSLKARREELAKALVAHQQHFEMARNNIILVRGALSEVDRLLAESTEPAEPEPPTEA